MKNKTALITGATGMIGSLIFVKLFEHDQKDATFRVAIVLGYTKNSMECGWYS